MRETSPLRQTPAASATSPSQVDGEDLTDYPCAPNSLAMAVEMRRLSACARSIGAM